MVDSLTERLAAEMDATDRILAESILGWAEPEPIAQQIASICQTHLHQDIVACHFWEVSVSFTIGLQLANGESVVLKCRSPENIALETLQAVCQVQQSLAEQGFPAPVILLPPVQSHGCLVSVEAMLREGDNENAHDPIVRQVMAAGLFELIQLACPFAQLPGLPVSRFRSAQLWEKPHNALFDFERTQSGAEWIDAIAQAAKTQLMNYDSPYVVGHMDWSIKNMRLKHKRLSAVYDWDSLRLENELVIVGNAINGFLVTWYVEVGSMVPTPEECQQFVLAYERARGQAFTAAERQVITAALMYSMAYTARCEHAIDPEGEKIWGSFRAALSHSQDYAL